MFEAEHSTVATLLETDQAFQRLYDKHADLNTQVDEATSGDRPMEDIEIETLKKEKLELADRMQAIIRDFHASH